MYWAWFSPSQQQDTVDPVEIGTVEHVKCDIAPRYFAPVCSLQIAEHLKHFELGSLNGDHHAKLARIDPHSATVGRLKVFARAFRQRWEPNVERVHICEEFDRLVPL